MATLPKPLATKAPRATSGATFAKLITEEVEAIETLCDDIWRLRVSGPALQRPILVLSPDELHLEASVSLMAGDDRARINMTLGAVLSFDDLALRALCDEMVLAPSYDSMAVLQSPELPEDFLTAMGDGLDRPDRFTNYQKAMGRQLDRAQATYAMPLQPWRLLQASLITELMIAFTLFHERVHFGLGHLDYIAPRGAAEIRLAEIDRQHLSAAESSSPSPIGAEMPAGAQRVLELQADSQAFLLLAAYALHEDGPCARYLQSLKAIDVPYPDIVLTEIDLAGGIRLCLTAAALACLAFRASMPIAPTDDPSHPHPHIRLMNMVTKVPILSPLVNTNEAGDFILRTNETSDADGKETPAFTDLIRGVFGLGLTDLYLCSTIIGEEFSPLEFSPEQTWAAAGWIHDLGCFWVSDAQDLNETPSTDAARELLFLLNVQNQMDSYLVRFQLTRFGEPMSLEVGDISADHLRPVAT